MAWATRWTFLRSSSRMRRRVSCCMATNMALRSAIRARIRSSSRNGALTIAMPEPFRPTRESRGWIQSSAASNGRGATRAADDPLRGRSASRVLQDVHIEGGGPIYEVSHHIGSKKVERVSLVAFGAAQSKVIAKITLKALTLTLSNRFAE